MAKTLIGTVSSNAADKTIVITVHTRKTHPLYRKQYTVTSKYMAHDEKNECSVGDKVSIVETRPLSARKRYKLEKVIEKAALSKEERALIEKSESEERAKEKAAQREEKKKAEAKVAKKELPAKAEPKAEDSK